MAICLFDIDLTLVDTDGAGREAMNAAFLDLYGVADAFSDMPFQGRTDSGIVREALEANGLLDGRVDDVLPGYIDVYAFFLERALTTGRGRVLPGVRALLAELVVDGNVKVGLATGNFRRSALLKLAHYGLTPFVSEGGFGDDHIDRAEVVAIGAKRVIGHPLTDNDRTDVVVIGDTPLDVAAAHANGFRALAVATGFCSAEELHASRAEIVVDDLSDTDVIRRMLVT